MGAGGACSKEAAAVHSVGQWPSGLPSSELKKEPKLKLMKFLVSVPDQSRYKGEYLNIQICLPTKVLELVLRSPAS